MGELLNSKGKRKLSAVPNGMPKKKAKLHAVLASEETLSECSSDEEDYNPCDDSQLTDNDNLPEDETLNDSDLEDGLWFWCYISVILMLYFSNLIHDDPFDQF